MKRNGHDGNRRGAVLVVVFVVTLILAILAGSLFVIFGSNTRSHAAILRRTRALYAAESGVSLAMHHLALETLQPGQSSPFFLPDDSLGWIDIPGSEDMALVVIDPMDGGLGGNSSRSVEIRSRGRSGNVETDVIIRAAPDTPSRYALITDQGIPQGYLTDGLILQGPVHSNGTIEFSSTSSDSTGDILVPEISTTHLGGFYFTDIGYSDEPHPHGSRVWVRPYPRHQAGSPSWNTGAGVIDFSRIHEHFRDLRTKAVGMGTCFSGVRRILLDGDMILMKRSVGSLVDTLLLQSGIDLLYLDNPGSDVCIRSRHTLTSPLTIVSTGTVMISGHIDALTTANGGPLAIVSLGDITIAQTPGFGDWFPPWNIATDGNVTVKAFLAAPSGEFSAENIFVPGSQAQFTIQGGLLAGEFGRTGTTSSGYRLALAYDTGLALLFPPHFPIFEYWKIASWEAGHDLAGKNITENSY
jgi:hypothetical protein